MPENISDYFGARLASIRDALDLKQSEIGEKLGCSNGAYSLYERNKRQPTLSVLLNLCSKFGVSIDYLLGYLSPSSDIFADRLRVALGKRSDKDLKEFVKDSGMDESAAKLLLSGACFPSAKVLKNLCEYLKCSSDFLIGLSDSIEPPVEVPVRITTSSIPREAPDPFDDLTPDQQAAIRLSLKAFREANAAKAKEA